MRERSMVQQVKRRVDSGVSPSIRRRLLCASSLLALVHPSFALMPGGGGPLPAARLDPEQSDRFRLWMTFIVAEQFKQGPSPRWFHRDCAGLARYAVGEALRVHDQRWRRASGVEGRRLPPELSLLPEQSSLQNSWTGLDGSRQAFVTAIALIQNNSRPLGKESAMARPGDLMFFDQGDEQHLMIWMGTWIAYHNGQTPVSVPAKSATRKTGKQAISTQDNGLRAVTPADLLQWKDTRWRPRDDNPNFAGFYRLAFLSR